ncbi:hypothetical protein [Paenibacillus sp. NPDC055715]
MKKVRSNHAPDFLRAWLMTIVNHTSPLRQEGAFMWIFHGGMDFSVNGKKTASSGVRGDLLFVVCVAC